MVLVFLSTRDARKCMENIISHASHAGFTCDTPLNYSGNGNACVECSFVRGFSCEKSCKTVYHVQTKKGKRIHAHCTVYRTSEERKYCTATFKQKSSVFFLFDYAIGYNN